MVPKPTLKQVAIVAVIALVGLGMTNAVAQTDDPTEGDDYDNPTAIQYGEEVRGELTPLNENLDRDFFVFEGEAGQTIQITYTNIQSSAPISFGLVGPDGDGIDTDVDPVLSSGETVSFDRTLTQSGTFRILAFPDNLEPETGTYTIEIVRTDRETPTPAATVTETTTTEEETATTTQEPTEETTTATETPTPTETEQPPAEDDTGDGKAKQPSDDTADGGNGKAKMGDGGDGDDTADGGNGKAKAD